MAEYIEREAAIDRLEKLMQLQAPTARAIIEAIPAADVQPVRHGRWVKTIGENGVTSACRCNLCGFEDNRYSLFNYCPNCGAHMMDGGKT